MDEYQDTNPIQSRMIDLFAAHSDASRHVGKPELLRIGASARFAELTRRARQLEQAEAYAHARDTSGRQHEVLREELGSVRMCSCR